jgi:glycosyltransferase involved in cell wall biosynthesis
VKVLFIFPYPHATAASQRFRFEQYLDMLTKNGINYTLAPFLDTSTWQILYKKGFIVKKTIGIVAGFLRRIQLLFTVNQYDTVFIHREASPLGPPLIEWIIAKILRKKVIYDFDDAIWLPNTSANNRIAAHLKWHHKTASICRWSYKVSTGNAYLAGYARQFNHNVIVNPTTIDTVHLHNRIKNQNTDKVVIGWTGTHSTINYLYALTPVLKELAEEFDFTFLVISDKQPDFELNNLVYLPWAKASEMDDLLKMNIGVMPLTDDLWAKGKCGFKALQYMALGIPALVSPVGVNTAIVEDGLNGYICQSADEWKNNLQKVLADPVLRMQMGRAARQKVEEYYSVQANCRTFLDLFLTA